MTRRRVASPRPIAVGHIAARLAPGRLFQLVEPLPSPHVAPHGIGERLCIMGGRTDRSDGQDSCERDNSPQLSVKPAYCTIEHRPHWSSTRANGRDAPGPRTKEITNPAMRDDPLIMLLMRG